MKMKKIIASAFAVTMLASCSANVEKVMENFETSVKGTAQLTFASKYKTDVISEKGGMDSFKHDVDDKVVADLDLTEGNLYLYVKNDANDKGVAKTREALLYKDGASYKYVTSVMENPLTLKDEASARTKIDELLTKISTTYTGSIDTSSLVFSKGGAYEHKEFGLSTTNIAVDEYIGKPTYKKIDKGVEITGDLDYIGYHTDAGISDFPGKDGTKAATYTINTNEKGYVTSYVENMNAELAMPIMNPAPLVKINGTKNLTANYGVELTKKNTIAHQLTTTELKINAATQGTIETFVTPTLDGEKTPVVDKAKLTVGQFLAVKVTPAGANTIKMVTFAGSSKETPEADGYFYFEILEGKADLTVNFVGNDVVDTVKYATTAFTPTADVTKIELVPFTMNNQNPQYETPVNVGDKVIVGKFVRIIPTVAEGKVVGEVKVDGKVITLKFNQYFFEAKEEKTYTITVTAKLPGEVVADPVLKPLNNKYEIYGLVSVYTCAPGDFKNMVKVEQGTTLKTGNWLCVKVNEGVTVKNVTLNEKQCMAGNPAATGGYYCFKLVAGDNILAVVQ